LFVCIANLFPFLGNKESTKAGESPPCCSRDKTSVNQLCLHNNKTAGTIAHPG
jgi:hypothetical protein